MSRLVLLDKSALARSPAVEHPTGEVELCLCPVTRLEMLVSARSRADYAEIEEALDAFHHLQMNAETFAVAGWAQRELADTGHHRIGIPDLLIAACAQQHSADVLHVDRHFDTLARVLDFRPLRLESETSQEQGPTPADVPIRCVYTDLDGTLLGRGGSLVHDADGEFTLLPVRGIEACHRAGVEVVLVSGRRKAQVAEGARLIGQSSYVYEVGCGLVIDGEETMLTGALEPEDGDTVFGLIERSGAPALLLERFDGRLEYHDPWHRGRDISHLFRGLVDAGEANELLEEHGHAHLRLVDNGAIAPRDTLGGAATLGGDPHVYHLIPRGSSKANAVGRHRVARGYEREECVGVGDSREDVELAEHVGRFFLVANGLEKDPEIRTATVRHPNVEVTESRNGEGFYEAVVGSLMAARA